MTQGKPLIAITVGRRNEKAAQTQMQAVIAGCNMDYVRGVMRAGGAPILVPSVDDTAALEAILAVAHGVLLTGGGDVLSLAYGEEPHPRSGYQDPDRDAMELMVARRAIERGIPVLGVCRGIQVLNVALGGTLIQDIPSQVPGALLHYAKPLDPSPVHTVEIEPESLLKRLVDGNTLAVNSYHHQAIKDLARGLRVNCRARDGVIEGVEAADDRPILAVQFHPEELADRNPQMQVFFDWLIRSARG